MQSTEQEQKPAAAGQFDGLLNVFKNRWKKKHLPKKIYQMRLVVKTSRSPLTNLKT